jgi:hypothetical protein
MTLLSTPPQRNTCRAPSKIRKARRAAQVQTQSLTDQIMAHGSAAAQAAQEAAAIDHGYLTPAEQQAWLTDMEARLAVIQKHPEQNLGEIEEQVARSAKEPLRLITQRAAQAKANATPCQCPQCKVPLPSQKFLRRTIDSRFGPLVVFRHYGWCSQCQEWHFPADYALGLGRKAPASPYIQEISALLVTKMPPEQAVLVAERFGLDLSRCTLHREAHRQGLKAEAARAQANAQLDAWEDIQALALKTEGPLLQPYTLVIEIDAWNIRERDHWGETKAFRAQGKEKEKELGRWHWVYMGTVFRLDQRGQTAGHRAIISQRGYVATRLGIEELTRQLHREAIQRGLGQAQQVLVIADGAVWIWNLAKDRFPDARQQLDLYHADENLWALANDLYGRGTPEARAWVAPLLQQIRDDQTPAIIQTLTELKPSLLRAQQEKLQTKIEYFGNNADRMKYKAIIQARKAVDQGSGTVEQTKLANQPLGSGAIESTCRQYQCRFKRTGQFWTTAGDEALMCLETFWRNGRWHQLYPHAKHLAALN